MSFPSKLKDFRQERNLTPKQMADLIEINPRTYRNYESGKTKPRVETFKRIVIALETTADELLEI